MSAHEAPSVPGSDQPPSPDHAEEMAQIEQLKAELGDRVGMLRDQRPSGRAAAALGLLRDNPRAAIAGAGAAVCAVALLGLARR
jgi:ferric-dicitrate binding protein FerR (iron transport regulator)